jgi:hypothetical protein
MIVRFLFDGNVLNSEGSAESLHMEDGDEIDAMLSSDGHSFVEKVQSDTTPNSSLQPSV